MLKERRLAEERIRELKSEVERLKGVQQPPKSRSEDDSADIK